MGRYFSYAIATNISVTRRSKNERVEKDKVLNELSNYIDVNTYNIKEIDDGNEIELSIKEDFINNNINDFLQEIKPLGHKMCSVLYTDVQDDTSTVFEPYENGHILKVGTDELIERAETLEFDNYWFFNKRYLIEEYSLFFKSITLWVEDSKISGEDFGEMLRIINKIKTNYFKNPLGKDLIFYISE